MKRHGIDCVLDVAIRALAAAMSLKSQETDDPEAQTCNYKIVLKSTKLCFLEKRAVKFTYNVPEFNGSVYS